MLTPFPLGRPARMAVLASGRGSNLEALLEAFPPGHPLGEVVLVLSDNPSAQALERARRRGVEALALPWRGRRAFEAEALAHLEARGVDLVLLAGFMRLLSPGFVEPWYGRLLNIHPSLLPAYPGLHVHRRVLEAGERETGSTVHFVDQGMDTGPILLQGRLPVLPGDTPETLERRVLFLEHRLYPRAVRLLLLGLAFPPSPALEPLLGEAFPLFQALPPREKPLYLRALALLRRWGQEALAPALFLGRAGEIGRAAFLAAHLLAEDHPALRQELKELPLEVRAPAEAELGRVESSP
ncbi:MAG: phosphoribosylglycinamide formyltransferase [Thermus sp.]|uniref:phosphoribosylglycinamide formyltransferase n=1 Tax=Thermus sp. TaxID=275 RepID=UPI0025CFC18F|nr:phosphoribosylglycinamide formyltransferase [Thermus sp.]MCS6869363.1 phosphoribosylglycinamide formyltransferase [Thermus sp.]MCS7217902.1 phosphoribosylglycinamide formyltransferase [Thermus sp.]MCX7850139.1 phosphoribosylglycinamide formyltransferase [Thermus sp.]MDW8016477.1 phosphoribosylglycinamide formyltransferase [Thermus sp.]MDW8357207.1 phosphoribosylglycinamide formyltransferase [Thermus sp.]